MYKIKNGLCPDYISRLFIIRSNQYNLRNNDLIIPRVNTTGYGKHSVRYLGPVLWPKIDRKIRELKTLDELKRKNIFYLIIVLTVLFAILNIVIIIRFVGGINRGDYIGIIWVLLVFNNVDRCPYLVGNCYFNLTR